MTHSGFLFGGHRNIDEDDGLGPCYPNGKIHGPEDCSSFIGKICDYEGVIATLYQWMFWQSVHDKQAYEEMLSQAPSGAAAEIREKTDLLGSHFQAIPLKEMRVGDVFGFRKQKSKEEPLKGSGHTGMLLPMLEIKF